ncbi:MAG: DUF2357 domain-containing protein [Deltaproteobacteria bacterium]|nr:DUF2357 domain-containing protein [Deltaproteobacteria bacterium]
MSILRYTPEIRMAIADEPMFPAAVEEVAACSSIDDALTLQDWKTYFVKFYTEEVPAFFPAPEQYYNYRRFPGQLFEIGFRNAAGLTRIGPVPVRVQSRKIPEALYQEMLDYIADQYANLAFSFDTLTGQHYGKPQAGRDIAYIEYLFLKKYLLDASPNLDGIAALILADPHRRLHREFRRCDISAVTSPHPAMLMSLLTSPERMTILKSGHPLLAAGLGRSLLSRTGRGLYPAEAIEEYKYHSVDTNENRFVKYLLETIQRRLDGLKKALTGKGGGYLNPEIEGRIGEMAKNIRRFLADPLWNDVGSLHFPPLQSQVLQRRDGYRQIFQLYCLLQLASRCAFDEEDFRNLLETKDTPTLFEYWSFFVVKEIMDSLLKRTSCGVIVNDHPMEQTVTQGICIHYEEGVSLWFNRSFGGSRGWRTGEGTGAEDDREAGMEEDYSANDASTGESYSHTLRPDMVISKGETLLIFDAKFKEKSGGFYCEDESGAITKWKEEDINKMHAYREAIRHAAGAYIIYPGETGIVYKAHDAVKPFEGVGAFPLKPETGAKPNKQHRHKIRSAIVDFIEKDR